MELRIWNPFKPHVAKIIDFDLYVVRKLTIWGWVYKDAESNDWWLQDNAIKHCIHFTATDAAYAASTKKKPFARLYAY